MGKKKSKRGKNLDKVRPQRADVAIQRRPAGGSMVAATTQTLSAPMLVVSKATTMPIRTTCPWKSLENFRRSQVPQALANGDGRRARRRRRHQRRLNPSRHLVAVCHRVPQG